jgi:dCTP deaminase
VNKFQILAAEVLERTIRIELLVRLATRQLAMSFRRDTAQSAAAEQIRHLLTTLVLEPLLEVYRLEQESEENLDRLKSLLKTVAVIHEGALPTVPRVVEPIELRSYLRQSGETTRNKNFPLVFASERLGMQVYPNSLAGLLQEIAERQGLIAKAKHSKAGIKDLARILKPRLPSNAERPFAQGQHAYVAIPAIDIHNPNRWPSLWHELAHHELENQGATLLVEFQKFVNGDNPCSPNFRLLCLDIAPLLSDAFVSSEMSADDTNTALDLAKNLIANWLRECWCDAYGVKQAGLGFMYSQLHDFMFCFDGYLTQPFQPGQTYPPAEMRLSLAANLALERLKHIAKPDSAALIAQIVNDYESEQALFYELSGGRELHGLPTDCISLLYNYFLHFLKRKILIGSSETFGGDISEEVFSLLERDLKNGFPIPSITQATGGARAARVSEIILAGWRNRNREMRAGMILALDAARAPDEANSSNIKELTHAVCYLIERSDESIKRSIQVAEWFSILHKRQGAAEIAVKENFGGGRPVDATITEITEGSRFDDKRTDESLAIGLLSDTDINLLLDMDGDNADRLRIVPLIDRSVQVKGTSIDLRLGHNFEVFQSLFESSIDACDSNADERRDSLQVEIDFLHGLPILPGQFVLGHTLEYIKLPANVAAQIEGRSSFARLGVQVHMTANLVEAGFDGSLTLEIHNNGPATVILYPGMRIAQLRVFKLANATAEGYDGPKNKYRGQLSHNKTKQFNDPEVLLFRSEREKREIR